MRSSPTSELTNFVVLCNGSMGTTQHTSTIHATNQQFDFKFIQNFGFRTIVLSISLQCQGEDTRNFIPWQSQATKVLE